MSRLVKPRCRCCDCKNLGILPSGLVACEGPIPDVYQPETIKHLHADDILAIRRCDCFEPKDVNDA